MSDFKYVDKAVPYSKPLDVLYFYDPATATYITPLVTGVSVSGDTAQAHRTCSITLKNTLNGRNKRIDIQNGKEIRFFHGETEVFRGIIFSHELTESGDHSIEAYDANYYLTKSADSFKFVNKKASDIVKTIATKYGLSVGKIDDTGYVFPKLVFRGETLYDVITTVLTETRKKNGKLFILRNAGGKLELREYKQQLRKVTLENERTLLSATYSESIDDLKNRVKVEAGDESYTEKDDDSVSNYGVLQHYEESDDPTRKAELARSLLKELNKPKQEFKLDAIGMNDVIAGSSIVVHERMTGIYGGFYVISDDHTYEPNGTHTMSLTLSHSLELSEMEYEEPDEPEEESAGTGGGSGSGSGASAPASSDANSSATFIRPASGTITSGFRGSRANHNGIDIAKSGSVPIYASASGVVTKSYVSSSYGEVIFIKHDLGGETYETVYAHMRTGTRKYKVGDSVKKGAVIGYMGNTGASRGQHLHFEVHRGRWNQSKSNAINPQSVL